MTSEHKSMGQAVLRPADPGAVRAVWERWGLPIVSVGRSYMPEEVEGLFLEGPSGVDLALITWAVDGTQAEIVTLDAFVQGRGHGTRLLDAAERELSSRGVQRVHVVTTNDNARALGFYVRRGYRLRCVHLDAMVRVRRIEPQVPLVGRDDIPLRDMWELEKYLDASDEQADLQALHVLTILAVEDIERSIAS